MPTFCFKSNNFKKKIKKRNPYADFSYVKNEVFNYTPKAPIKEMPIDSTSRNISGSPPSLQICSMNWYLPGLIYLHTSVIQHARHFQRWSFQRPPPIPRNVRINLFISPLPRNPYKPQPNLYPRIFWDMVISWPISQKY